MKYELVVVAELFAGPDGALGVDKDAIFRVLERPVQLIVEQVNPGYYGAERAAAPALNAAPASGGDNSSMPGMVMPPNDTATPPADPGAAR